MRLNLLLFPSKIAVPPPAASNPHHFLRLLDRPAPRLRTKAGGNQYLRQVAALIPNVKMTDANVVRGSQPSGQTLSLLKQWWRDDDYQPSQ